MPEAEAGACNRAPAALLSFDYGDKRLGVAVGQTVSATGSPLKTLRRRSDGWWHGLDELLREWQPVALIIGVPYDRQQARQAGAGPEGDVDRRALDFAVELERRYGLPVHRVDEGGTTRAAREIHKHNRQRGQSRTKERGYFDGLAATLILERWFEQQGSP